jgi:hypothetical protein
MSSMYPNSGGVAARPCMRCGTMIVFNQSQCPQCGMYNPVPQQPPFGQFNAVPGGNMQIPPSPQMGGTVWPKTTGQLGTGWPNTLNQPPVPSQPLHQSIFSPQQGVMASGQLNNAFSPFQQSTNQASVNTLFQSSQPNVTPSPQVNIPGMAQRGWAQQAPGRYPPASLTEDEDESDRNSKRPSIWVVITILVLVCILIGSGIFVGTSILGNHGSTASSSSLTPIVTPTGTPLFSESFQNNNAGWDLSQPSGAKITLSGGKLVLESDNHELFPELLPQKTFGDFRLDIDAGLTKGNQANGYGVYIRAASTQDSPLGIYYRFEIYGNGYFGVYKGTQDANGDTQSATIKTGANTMIYPQPQINHLTVLAKGSQMIFQVNNTTVYTLVDTSYKNGSVALFVSNVSNVTGGAQATFEKLAIFADA